MASVNKVILIGNLGRDPEMRSFPDGGSICNVTLATTRSWKDKNSGERVEETEWHRIVFRDRLAEIASEYLRKGKQVYVEGRLKTRKYTDKDGVDKYTTEVMASDPSRRPSRPASTTWTTTFRSDSLRAARCRASAARPAGAPRRRGCPRRFSHSSTPRPPRRRPVRWRKAACRRAAGWPRWRAQTRRPAPPVPGWQGSAAPRAAPAGAGAGSDCRYSAIACRSAGVRCCVLCSTTSAIGPSNAVSGPTPRCSNRASADAG